MALTNRQRAFVEAYLANGFNATKAAITAGYSEKTARSIGSENLTNPDISALVEERIKSLAMTANEALARLSEHASGDMGDFLNVAFEDLATHPQSRLIKKVKRTVTIRRSRKDDEETETEHFEIELYDAQAAQLAVLKEQHLKAGEATEITDDASLTDDQRANRIAELLELAKRRAEQADQ